ncbi:MAG: peptidase S24 [Flavobacteriaceae bacterium]|nr:peptidase S24 [Flavobacteriaceae bacterium]
MEIISSGKLKGAAYRHAPEVSKQTGFPSAATHYLETPIDLHKELAIHKDATFYVRIGSDTWSQFNILKNDVLIVDRSLTPNFNDLALMIQEGEFTVNRLVFNREQEEFTLWGVITYIIHYAR